MENHELAIGTMKTACRVAAWPQAVAPLRARLERSIAGPLPALIAKAAEPVLDGREGVIRIRSLKLDLAHHGEWDERTLASLIASKLAAALAGMLDRPADAVRFWPDHDTYMAGFIEHKLGFAHEPDWAFPEFAPLRLLAPEHAAAEVLKARPSVLPVLAANGRRVGNAQRVATRLGADTAADLVNAFLHMPDVSAGADPADLADPGLPGILHKLGGTQNASIHQQILMLILEMSLQADKRAMPQLITAAIIGAAIAALRADKAFSAVHGRSPSAAIAELPAAALPLPAAIAGLLKRTAAKQSAPPILDRLFELAAGETKRDPAFASRKKGKSPNRMERLQTIHSPFAGFALLLPGIVRLGMHRHLSKNGLRQTVLAVAEAEMRERLYHDELFETLFPDDDEPEPSFPPVPGAMVAMLAPESRNLVSGREGADGWADLLLAGFASRLPGLRASSRGYLIRQFLAIEGKAEIAKDAIVMTLDGPPLAIVLKMAGLSGEQMPIPFLGNRLLVLKLGGGR